ncbi:MAG: hypothetical protein LBG59_06615 [Candidatus Peribacteria bacterium]|nr:hypothetical protein [Candidatus Peribacteria bacterium]
MSGYTGAVAILSASDTANPRTPRQASDGTTPCTEALALTDVVCSYHYSDKIFSNAIMLAGNTEMPSKS